MMLVYAAVLVVCCLCSTSGHPERPDIPDNPNALRIFQAAKANQANLTSDPNSATSGYLSDKDMADIFSRFDINDNGNIDETEFIAHWTTMNLGDLEHAVTLFHRADTDKDGAISKTPDFSRLFYYFDRNDGEENHLDVLLTHLKIKRSSISKQQIIR